MKQFSAISFVAAIAGAMIVSLAINIWFQRENAGRLKACEVEFFGSDGTPLDRDTVSDQLRDQQNEIYQLQLALAKEIEQSDTRWDVVNGHIHNLQESVDNLSAKIPPAAPTYGPDDEKFTWEEVQQQIKNGDAPPPPPDRWWETPENAVVNDDGTIDYIKPFAIMDRHGNLRPYVPDGPPAK